jgi:hypothetical protein
MSDKFDAAKIVLPDGRVGYDCLKLANIPTEGIFLRDYPNHMIQVRTQYTLYTFITRNGAPFVEGIATANDGGSVRYLAEQTGGILIQGSTWGGSMLKLGYIGVDMHLEFDFGKPRQCLTTSRIASIQVMALDEITAPTEHTDAQAE